MSTRKLISLLCPFFLACALLSLPAFSQDDNASSQASSETTVEGTVVSSSSDTFAIKTDEGQNQSFTYSDNANKPRSLSEGDRVRVTSTPGASQSDPRQATRVEVMDQASGNGSGRSDSTGSSSSSSTVASAQQAAPLPPQVRHVEKKIERETHRWRMGARAGVGLDPELILFGIHSQMGPVFSRHFYFRPNADFEWGEITDMVALNLEPVYRFPYTTRSGRWEPYVGLGPSLNFIHQSFQAQAGQRRDISFGNFTYQTGLNVFLGFENRHHTFFEVKTSIYSEPAPVLRLILGRDF